MRPASNDKRFACPGAIFSWLATFVLLTGSLLSSVIDDFAFIDLMRATIESQWRTLQVRQAQEAGELIERLQQFVAQSRRK
ncbi:MAG: hypothetical protein SVX28_03050 [Pseudomonadota bacterium]|nr:hypothetical protein [Pseudomonadota bacterium]